MGQSYAPYGDRMPGFGEPVQMPAFGDPVTLPIGFFEPNIFPDTTSITPHPDVAIATWDGVVMTTAPGPARKNVVAMARLSDAELLLTILGVDRDKWCAIAFGDPICGYDQALVVGDFARYATVDAAWFATLRLWSSKVIYL